MSLSEHDVQQFREQGFVIVKQAIQADRLGAFREAAERMVEKVRAADPEQARRDYKAGYLKGEGGDRESWRCDGLLHPDIYEPEFTELLGDDALMSKVESIIGPGLRIGGLKALWSPERLVYNLRWHRDGPDDSYKPDGSQDYLQFNVALYEDTSFMLVPGSHARPLNEAEWAQINKGGTDPLPGQLTARLEAGDALFMHSRAVHRGQATPDVKRRTLHYTLASKHKPALQDTIDRHRWFYDQLGLADTLPPRAREQFENLFAWDGQTLDQNQLVRAAY